MPSSRMPIPLLQIDAFTNEAFAGNPAAVCVLPAARDAAWLLQVAREMNLVPGTALEISSSSTSIILKKRQTRRRRSLSQIVAQINPTSYRRHNCEFLADTPVGREIS